MATVDHFFDIWIPESKTGYSKVPFSVVTDWLQQGRLLAEDLACVSGTKKFARVGTFPAFAPFLPKVEPFRAEDKAEALEPVHGDVGRQRRRGDEEEDVDMIPLIDVSLVLLIFFMMTASAVSNAASSINTPEARFKSVTMSANMPWIGIDRDSDGRPRYSMGKGDKSAGEDFGDREQLLAKFLESLREEGEGVTVRIRAHRQLPYEVVRQMIIELEKHKMPRGKIANILAEVTEKETR
jgi:biopolymer transport protein ExbD